MFFFLQVCASYVISANGVSCVSTSVEVVVDSRHPVEMSFSLMRDFHLKSDHFCQPVDSFCRRLCVCQTL